MQDYKPGTESPTFQEPGVLESGDQAGGIQEPKHRNQVNGHMDQESRNQNPNSYYDSAKTSATSVHKWPG